MITLEQVKQFATINGYKDVEPLGEWRGYEIYEPILSRDKTCFIGPPLMIMVKGDTIRMSTPEEGMEQIAEMPDDEGDG